MPNFVMRSNIATTVPVTANHPIREVIIVNNGSGPVAWACWGTEGNCWFDVSDPDNMVQLGNDFNHNVNGSNSFEVTYDAVQLGNRVFTVARVGGETNQEGSIEEWDISDPNPANWTNVVGSVYKSGAAFAAYSSIASDGVSLYVSGQISGVWKFDPSDIASGPIASNTINNGTTLQWETQGGAVGNGYYYAANYRFGLRVVDSATMQTVDNPYSTPNDSFGNPMRPWQGVVNGNWLYMSGMASDTGGFGCLFAVDISDPLNIAPLGTNMYEIPAADRAPEAGASDQFPLGIRFLDNKVYLGNGDQGTLVWDVTSPTAASYVGCFTSYTGKLAEVSAAPFKLGGETFIFYGIGDSTELGAAEGTRAFLEYFNMATTPLLIGTSNDYADDNTIGSGETILLSIAPETTAPAPANAFIDEFTMSVFDSGGPRTFKLTLYSGDPSIPANLVAGTEQVLVNSNTAASKSLLTTGKITPIPLVEGTTYYVAETQGTSQGGLVIRDDGVGTGARGETTGGVFPASWTPNVGTPSTPSAVMAAIGYYDESGGTTPTPPLDPNTSLKLNRHGVRADIAVATGSPATGADEVAIWLPTSIDMSDVQSNVGTFQAISNYIKAEKSYTAPTGSAMVFWAAPGGTYKDVQVNGTPADTDLRIEVGDTAYTDSGRLEVVLGYLLSEYIELSAGT